MNSTVDLRNPQLTRYSYAPVISTMLRTIPVLLSRRVRYLAA
jgi:hypothetical protein